MDLEKNQTKLDFLTDKIIKERDDILSGKISMPKAKALNAQSKAIINIQLANIQVKHQALQYVRIAERKAR